MANAYSTSDLVKAALWRAGERTDGTSDYHETALSYINNIYHAVLSGSNEFDIDIGEAWTWARAVPSRNITLLPAYESGTVALTNGLATGTFSVAPTYSVAGYFLKTDTDPTYYEILTHTASSTSFTLTSAFVETTATALTFKAIKLAYDLGTKILRQVGPLRIFVDRKLEYSENETDEGMIYGIDIDRFRKEYPLRDLENDVPTRFATYARSESQWLIFVNKYPSDQTRVEFDVIEVQPDLTDSDVSIPLLPREFRILLAYGAAGLIWIDKGNTERAGIHTGLMTKKLVAMKAAEQKDSTLRSVNKARLIPRRDSMGYPRTKC